MSRPRLVNKLVETFMDSMIFDVDGIRTGHDDQCLDRQLQDR
jgi:hypothetical protein